MIAVALATRHGKESLFAPRLATIGYRVALAPVDTDAFGTFTGDVPRLDSPRNTVIAKARAAITATGLPHGLASEGSFAPHPDVLWVTIDTELVAMVDDASNLVVVESCSAVADVPPAFHGDGEAELPRSLLADLPGQALIARPRVPVQRAQAPCITTGITTGITKGITAVTDVHAARRRAAALSADGVAIVEPDLRAHHCPARRAVIADAIDRLVRRLATRCPSCAAVGYGEVRARRAARCRECGTATARLVPAVVGCVACEHATAAAPSDVDPSEVDPARCPRCNP